MPLSIGDLESIIDKVNAIDYYEWLQIITELNRTEELNTFLSLIKHLEFNTNYTETLNNKKGKVLIIGQTSLSREHIENICTNLGIHKKRLELHLDYEDSKNYNFDSLRYNDNYAVILIWPGPHKTKSTGKYSSVISKIMNTSGFPCIKKLVDSSNSLKFSKNSLQNALKDCISNDIIAASH